MARTDALQGALPLLVLKILVRRGPLHGYAITSQIERISADVLRVEEGSLYPALHRMEESGWVKAQWVVTDNKRRARVPIPPIQICLEKHAEPAARDACHVN